MRSGSFGSDAVKEEHTRFILTKPGEKLSSSKLFVSNDPEDGYDLTFANLAEFETWRRDEEETHTVEFVKGDTHTSRTNPPRFKEHVKLVCARHTRRGRKQYVKKHPERTRKTPSRKIDGVGCPATICYKTYVDTTVVRAMYTREHSHPTGPDNLPFTRKGQKALTRTRSAHRMPASSTSGDESLSVYTGTGHSAVGPNLSDHSFRHPVPHGQRTYPESGSDVIPQHQALGRHPSVSGSSSQTAYTGRVLDQQSPQEYQSPYTLEPPSPVSPPIYGRLPLRLPDVPSARDRWERLAVLFRSVRAHALSFQYPDESVGALEGVLVKLYLESPLGGAELGMEEAGMGALGEGELGVGSVGIGDVGGLGCVMEDVGTEIPHAHHEPHPRTQPHPQHHLRPG